MSVEIVLSSWTFPSFLGLKLGVTPGCDFTDFAKDKPTIVNQASRLKFMENVWREKFGR
jgi:hypothetical protein